MAVVAVTRAAPGNWPAVQPGCDLRATALNFVPPAGVTINELFAYPLSQIQLAARTRAVARARNILEAVLTPTLVLMNTLSHNDIREATAQSTGLPRWPAAYTAETRISRLTIAAWHRFALQLPCDDWQHAWENERPGRREFIVRTLRCRLGSTISCVTPSSRGLPHSTSVALPGVLNCDELFRRAATIFPANVALLQALQLMLPGSFYNQRCIFLPDGPGQRMLEATAYTLNAFDPMLPTPPTIVWFALGRVVAVAAPSPLPRAPTGYVTGSRWVHEAIRWDFDTRKCLLSTPPASRNVYGHGRTFLESSCRLRCCPCFGMASLSLCAVTSHRAITRTMTL